MQTRKIQIIYMQQIHIKVPIQPVWRYLLALLSMILWTWTCSAKTCSAAVPSSAAITSDEYTFSGVMTTKTTNVIAGPVSSSLYYQYDWDFKVVLRKVDTSGTETWLSSYTLQAVYKAFAIDSTEVNLYTAAYTTEILIARFSASTGALLSQHEL